MSRRRKAQALDQGVVLPLKKRRRGQALTSGESDVRVILLYSSYGSGDRGMVSKTNYAIDRLAARGISPFRVDGAERKAAREFLWRLSGKREYPQLFVHSVSREAVWFKGGHAYLQELVDAGRIDNVASIPQSPGQPLESIRDLGVAPPDQLFDEQAPPPLEKPSPQRVDDKKDAPRATSARVRTRIQLGTPSERPSRPKPGSRSRERRVRMDKPRVAVVTGSSGFLGRHLVKALLSSRLYDEVRSVDLAPRADAHAVWKKNRNSSTGLSKATFTLADLTDLTEARAAVEGAEVVFHLAGIVDTRSGALHQERIRAANVQGTRNIVAASRSAEVSRLLFVSSSCAVCDGWAQQQQMGLSDRQTRAEIDYKGATGAACDYARSKYDSEQIVLGANGARLRTTALRPNVVYGPGDPLSTELMLFGAIPPPLLGDGTNLITPCYVKNLAIMLIQTDKWMQRSPTPAAGPCGRSFFVSDPGGPITLSELRSLTLECRPKRLREADARSWAGQLAPYSLPLWFSWLLACVALAVDWATLGRLRSRFLMLTHAAVYFTTGNFAFDDSAFRSMGRTMGRMRLLSRGAVVADMKAYVQRKGAESGESDGAAKSVSSQQPRRSWSLTYLIGVLLVMLPVFIAWRAVASTAGKRQPKLVTDIYRSLGAANAAVVNAAALAASRLVAFLGTWAGALVLATAGIACAVGLALWRGGGTAQEYFSPAKPIVRDRGTGGDAKSGSSRALRRRLFSPLTIRGVRLRNRIIKAATFEAGCDRYGRPADSLIRLHEEVAKGGAAVTTVAYAAISPDGRTFATQLLVDEASAPGLQRLTDAVHRWGGKAMIQLTHAGYFADRKVTGVQQMGASVVFNPAGLDFPRQMTDADIERVTYDFAAAASLAVQCGFDIIQVHCGHGYLLSQFVSRHTNRRTDRYGGPLANRLRFPVDVIRRVREAVGPDVAIAVKMNMSDGFSGGTSLSDAIRAVQAYELAGADLIIPSAGWISRNGFFMLRGTVPLFKMARAQKGWVKWLALLIFGPFFVPTIQWSEHFLESAARLLLAHTRRCNVCLIGGVNTGEGACDALAQGFSAVCMGRALLRSPDFPRQLKTDFGAENLCSHCNQCIVGSTMAETPLACVERPRVVRDIEDVSA